ncbi:hypothetical protein [Bradyrhizobium sp. ERR14]|uniref:hypothetical protein n=1 Tax=Bradyrhizobium sp. ERR14 TaxID=2663837 RepID=UPI0017B74EA4|nr:hypothetical protein [Bradyrhizobium sp. ERR14]MBB4395680.1 hypothetical protein [Bradyrhizobium sp. ERR14]
MTATEAGAAFRQLRSGFDTPLRPGFSLPRLGGLMSRALAGTLLDLSELTVLTEAATGAYAVTAVLAAMAGARHVYAFTKATRHGTAADARQQTLELADSVGVADRIDVLEQITPDILQQTDIVTNSGHLRPLTAALIDKLPRDAVIALMFETWEFRPEDLDMEACLRRGIPIVGVNERHPSVDVFSFLGPLCVKQLHDCGLSVYKNRIAVLCDNDFVGSLRAGLANSGASVDTFDDAQAMYRDEWDAVIVALRPAAEPRIGSPEATHLAACVPAGAIVVQFWGDMDRTVLSANGLGVWPTAPPASGHMGILLSEIGPEPIVRLQAGGLRAAEWVRRSRPVSSDGVAQIVAQPRSSFRRFTPDPRLDELDERERRGGEKHDATHVERDGGRG